MPENRIATAIERVCARLRVRAALWALASGGITITAINVLAAMVAIPPSSRHWIAATLGFGITAWMMRANWTVTAVGAARLVEARHGSLENLLVTAVELAARPRPVLAEIRDEIVRQAGDKLAGVDVAAAVPLRQPLVVMLAVAIGSVSLLVLRPAGLGIAPIAIDAALHARSRGIDGVTVHVTPPAYSGRRDETFRSPVQIGVLAGSRVRLEVASAADGVTAEIAGQPLLTLTRTGAGFAGEWIAAHATAIAIRPAGGEGRDAKFLSVMVVPDAPPILRVPTPGRDVTVAGPGGRITIEVDAQDDLALASLAVQFTKASGGGEALTFTEGEVPLNITRADERHWRGRADWVLDALELTEGDVLVYRAIARDRNPNGRAVQSEQYLVEVGGRSAAGGSGFALPAEEKKYAISQQMVIYKTEQLIASAKGKGLASRSPGDGWLDQHRLLAIEQRMVRAEAGVLGGDEVHDEVEEAQQSQDLVEGRLENAGLAEMLKAINFMSRAEAQLNDGRAVEALALEREALRSLERAFDRRRYFLRTLPDRSRIDATRRLSGEVKDARSWARDRRRADPSAALDRQRGVMRALAAAANAGAGVDAGLAARVAGLDAADAALQQAAVALAAAATDDGRRQAVWAAMRAVTALAIRSLASAAEIRLAIDPLAGPLADEMARPGRVRP